MIRKSILVSFIAFTLFFMVIFLFSPKDIDADVLVSYFFYTYLMLILPIGGLIFVVLLVLNWIIKKEVFNRKVKNIKQAYFYYGLILSLIPILGFAIFDLLQKNRIEPQSNSFVFVAKYVSYLVLALVVIILNKKLVWKNFSDHNEGVS